MVGKEALHSLDFRIVKPKFARYQLLVHCAALAPLAWLVTDALTGNLGANPIQAIEQRTGRYALYLLVASLACTPIQIVTGWVPVIRWRRPLGVYAFGYAALHFVTFIGLDYGFNLVYLWADVGNKRYIFVGAAAFLILLALAVTSTKGWQKRLGKRWQRLHRWVYLAGGLVVIHYAWAVKSDIRQPLLWGVIIGLGLLLRLPVIRRFFLKFRVA
ncbi:MAG: sulfite oxidase heme-binding subunit YedZ [Anaerolineae bacterium]